MDSIKEKFNNRIDFSYMWYKFLFVI